MTPDEPTKPDTTKPIPNRPDWWTPEHETAALAGIDDGRRARGELPPPDAVLPAAGLTRQDDGVMRCAACLAPWALGHNCPAVQAARADYARMRASATFPPQPAAVVPSLAEQLADSYRRVQQAYTASQADLTAARADLDAAKATVASLRELVDHGTDEIRRLRADMADTRAILDAAGVERLRAEADAEQLRAELLRRGDRDDLVDDLARARKDLAGAADVIARLERECDRVAADAVKAREERDVYRHAETYLRKAEAPLDAEHERCAADAARLRKGWLIEHVDHHTAAEPVEGCTFCPPGVRPHLEPAPSAAAIAGVLAIVDAPYREGYDPAPIPEGDACDVAGPDGLRCERKPNHRDQPEDGDHAAHSDSTGLVKW